MFSNVTGYRLRCPQILFSLLKLRLHQFEQVTPSASRMSCPTFWQASTLMSWSKMQSNSPWPLPSSWTIAFARWRRDCTMTGRTSLNWSSKDAMQITWPFSSSTTKYLHFCLQGWTASRQRCTSFGPSMLSKISRTQMRTCNPSCNRFWTGAMDPMNREKRRPHSFGGFLTIQIILHNLLHHNIVICSVILPKKKVSR